MNVTKALSSLKMVTGRGMDNGIDGAVMLANQVCTVVHDLEQKRADCLKAEEKEKKDKGKKAPAFKSSNQMDKEKADAKWQTAKVDD